MIGLRFATWHVEYFGGKTGRRLEAPAMLIEPEVLSACSRARGGDAERARLYDAACEQAAMVLHTTTPGGA